METARKHTSKILDELLKPFEQMTDEEKIDYLQTENKMLKMALDEADKSKRNSGYVRKKWNKNR